MDRLEQINLLLDRVVDEINDILSNDEAELLEPEEVLLLAFQNNMNTPELNKSPLVAEIDKRSVMFDMGDDWQINLSGGGEEYDED
jgi:hypothetical protein